ncbi:MAG: pyridoxal phosphate-dependent aminotransferase [Fibrobacter sp.]|nr:pyridoxal phosphate-dependent aminotransferase [Fibrobacter sp.]
MNFDEVVNRRGTNSLKWDVPENELPLWVADMDFATAPAVVDAIKKRTECAAFGYSIIPEEWNQAYVGWWKRRYNYEMDPESLIFCTGVVPAISSIVRKVTTPAENVVILTPVYNIFFNSIVNNGRNVLQCPLRYDEAAADKCRAESDKNIAGENCAADVYGIDWDALEKALANPQTSLLIFCNPHNPVGKIWTAEEIARVGELCRKHSVTVISDEIHCDLTKPDKRYISFASVSETCRDISIVCMAPTKTFNIAGLQTAAVSVANPTLRHKVWRGLNTDEVAEPNVFAIQAAIAAYNEGEPWLDELLQYIQGNRELVADFIAREIPQVKLIDAEATYLLWLDCRDFCKRRGMNTEQLEKDIRDNAQVFISKGSIYGDAGEGFMRMNIACTKATLQEALSRLKAYFGR